MNVETLPPSDNEKRFETKPSEPDDVVFPNTVRDGGLAEEFLWKGLPNPSPVQRIAAWLISSIGIVGGLVFVVQGVYTLRDDQSWLNFSAPLLIGAVFIFCGGWVFRLGFPKRRTKSGTPPTGSIK